MRLNSTQVGALALLLFVCLGGSAAARAADANELEAIERLRALPGLTAIVKGDVRMFSGVEMARGATASEALALWLAEHAAALGVRAEELVPHFESALATRDMLVVAYRQSIDGVPVEGSRVRLLIRLGSGDLHDAPGAGAGAADPATVVHAASAGCARRPAGGFDAIRLDAAGAAAIARTLPESRDLDQWAAAELVILGGRLLPNAAAVGAADPAPARRAWKIAGRSSDRAAARSQRFYVDAASGALLRSESAICHADITGNVAGNATPGLDPDTSSNPPTEAPLGGVIVEIEGGDQDFADASGDYLVSTSSTGTVNVRTALIGESVEVINVAGADALLEADASAPDTVDFLFNTSESEATTAEVNGFLHTQGAHDFISDRAPDFTGIDQALLCFVNIADTCNAYYDPFDTSINFFASGVMVGPGFSLECVNTAYASVISHEYGHFVVEQLGLAQNSFGEGFGDSLSMLRHDDPVIGPGFFTSAGAVRNPESADQQYPCTSTETHACGQVLAGCWWGVRVELEAELGGAEGLAEARQLFADWMQVTVGAIYPESADETTVTEVLTVADDDGDLGNGAPNRTAICSAFADHGIDCPGLPPLAFEFPDDEFPDGRPAYLAPDGSTTFTLRVLALTEEPASDTGTLYYSVNGGAFSSQALVETTANEYEVTIPVSECGDQIRYYFGALDGAFDETLSPLAAPDAHYVAIVASEVAENFFDDFEIDLDWSTGDPSSSDTATSGVWTRVDPRGTIAQPEDDHSELGDFCFVTGQGSIGGGPGENDVDAGKTTLRTPVLDLSAGDDYYISYWRWYSNSGGAAPNADTFRVDISDSEGDSGTWVNVETVGPTGEETSGGWFFHKFRVRDFVEANESVMLRFVAEDASAGSLIEAALDDFRVEEIICDEPAPIVIVESDFRRGDCNGSGDRDISDPIFLLRYFFTGGAAPPCDDACDGNDDAALGIGDVLSILGALFLGETLPAPNTGCGADGVPDTLSCETLSPDCA